MKTLIEEYGVFIISLFTVIIVLLMSTTFTRKAETSSKYALGDFEAQYEQKIGENTGGSGGTDNEGSNTGGTGGSGDDGGNTGGSGGENPSNPDNNPNTSTITHIHDYSITTYLQEPTCTEKGYEIQKCSKCSKQQTVEIKALEHNMTDEVTKQPTCTATGTRLHTCLRCGYNYNTVEAILPHPYSTSWTVDIQEKCLTDGSKSRHCTVCDAKGYITRIPALGHKYITKTYTWASNGSSCSGKTICEHDSSHVVTEQATVITTVKTQPTCTTKGTHTYTANFTNSLFTQQVKDLVDINQLGHTWGTPTYTWSSTGSTCTAKRVCTRDSSHVEQQNATISSTVTLEATCTTAGKHKYTATFTNSAFSTQTKEIQDIAALNHSYSSTYTIDVQPTCTTQGSKSRHCTRSGCTAKVDVTTIPATGHSYENGVCIRCGAALDTSSLLYKTYNFAGYKWDMYRSVNAGNHGEYPNWVTLSCHGVTAGPWPGLKYSYKQYGMWAGFAYADIHEYNQITKDLYEKIKNVEFDSSYGKPGLYLFDDGLLNWHGVAYLKESMNYNFGQQEQAAWLSCPCPWDNSFPAAWSQTEYTVARDPYSILIVAPAFDLDLYKVRIEGDNIYID